MANKTMGKSTTSAASSWWKERSKILASIKGAKPVRAKPKKSKAKKTTKPKKTIKAKKTKKASKIAGKTRKATKSKKTKAKK